MLLPTATLPVADPEVAIAKARAHEEETGYTINTLAISNRHLGRGYSLGGFYFPRSRYSENSSYIQMVNAYATTLDFWAREFAEKDITLVINGTKEAAAIGRARGLPFRYYTGSRYQNYNFWTYNEFDESPEIEAAFERIAAADDAPEIEEPYLMNRVLREVFLDEVRLVTMLKRMAYLTARQAYWILRGYKKAKGYYLKDNLRHHWRTWVWFKRINRMCRVKLSDLEGQRFVYYPLHLEPERAIQGLSPEYMYQLSSIAALSRDLPAGVLLAVKEQYNATGRRPDDFYGQIAEFKNVVLLEMMEPGLNVVRKCDAVATICGTGGFEAAVMGTPVIAFGRHNTYNFLPHVRVVTEESALKRHLADALDGTIDAEQARRDGKRFLTAVLEASFDLRDYNRMRLDSFEAAAVEDCYATLARSLEAEDGSTGLRQAV